jgi:ankyrin repeat protein
LHSFNPQTSVEAPRPKTVDDERGLTTQLSNITAIQSRLSLDDRPQAPVLAPLTQEPESSSAYKEDDNGSTVLLDGLRPWPVPPHLYRCPLKECAKGLPEGEYRRVWNYESFIRHLLEGHVYGDKHDVYSTRVSGPEQILLWASRRGHDAIIKTLLDNGTNVETRDRRGYTPLAAAAYEGYDNVVRLLLDKGADREARNKNARTPLALATRKGDVDSLKLLIQRGADIDSRDSFGDTPLTVAATHSHEEVVEQLVQGGANLESRNDGDNTPLLLATGARRRAIVRLLLKYGANPESKNKAGYSPLSIAETRTDDGILRLLQDAVEGRRPTEP